MDRMPVSPRPTVLGAVGACNWLRRAGLDCCSTAVLAVRQDARVNLRYSGSEDSMELWETGVTSWNQVPSPAQPLPVDMDGKARHASVVSRVNDTAPRPQVGKFILCTAV